MNAKLREMEREIDAGLEAIGSRLDAAGHLRPQALERIRAAVLAEAACVAARRSGVRRLARWSTIAVAAAIALVMTWPAGSRTPKGEALLEGPLSVSDWVVAAGESGEQITMLLEGDWRPEDWREPDLRHDSLEEALDSLEDSLSAMESVFGA